MRKKGTIQYIRFDEIRKLLHDNAETGFAHTSYSKESERFHLLLSGDIRAVEESEKIINPSIQGTLSKDPLRNLKYLFIINTGLASRYMIEAGIPQETVYSTCDVYIQRADVAKTEKEIRNLNKEIWTIFVNMVRDHKKGEMISKPVHACLEYIDMHFNEKITLKDLSTLTGLNECYLAVLFKKETGKTFSDYLTDIRINTSKALLSHTDYSYSQIALSLGFCSQSHFTQVFRNRTDSTPKQYRMKNYNTNLSGIHHSFI